jgi:1-acyl-sn-glycerol-3-phosphate acyltransferase
MDGQFGEGVLVARGHFECEQNAIAAMGRALDEGASLILFPERTRGPGSQVQPLRQGYFILHRQLQTWSLYWSGSITHTA